MTRKKPSKTTRADAPVAPFAAIVAGSKTDHEQLRALEEAAQRQIPL
jgi:hypothetical protein